MCIRDRYIADAKKYILQSEFIEDVQRHLNEARENIDALPDAWQYYNQQNMAKAAQVDSYIMNIGEVIYTAYVKTSIQIARMAYDSLTEEQQGLVTLYQTLLDAETAWAALEEENDFTEEDLALAAQVDAYIEQIGEVTLESGTVIETARYAFDSLTEQQQTLVNDPKKLFDAEKRYNQLWADSVAAKIAAIGEVSSAPPSPRPPASRSSSSPTRTLRTSSAPPCRAASIPTSSTCLLYTSRCV